MAITEGNRHQLFTRLEEVLGREEATVLMEHLPPVGWADVATKRDLDLLESRIDARFAAARADFADLRSDFADLRSDFADLRSDFADLRTGVAELRAEVHRDQRDLQRNLFFGLATMQAAFAGLIVALVG